MPKQPNHQRLTSISPTWCPGCGNFGILTAINKALDKLSLASHQTVFVYDVGCSGNMADFVFSYGFHGLHGRALPLAAGIKLANHQLNVICIIGDGGCYGEGLNHLIELAKGNHDITVITHSNYRYSLTTGQKSPITPKGTKTPSTPDGSIEESLNPLVIALTNHATFVARGFSSDTSHLTELLTAAITHTGFALLDVLQLCPTYNKDMTQQWYQKHVYNLADSGHQLSNRAAALKKAQEKSRLPVGIFFQQQKPAYHQQLPVLTSRPLVQQKIDRIDIAPLLTEFS
jgi:2-oxoglutarate ferredoxin oxidoreductase subunit beta